MSNSNTFVPSPENEPILSYAPGSRERKEVLKTYKKLYNTPIEVPLFIGGKEIKTGHTASMHPPTPTNIIWVPIIWLVKLT